MEGILYHSLSGLVGAVCSLLILVFKVLPGKVSREEVSRMLEDQPLHFQVRMMQDLALQDRTELRAIRDELIGLREDMARQTALLEGVLRNRD